MHTHHIPHPMTLMWLNCMWLTNFMWVMRFIWLMGEIHVVYEENVMYVDKDYGCIHTRQPIRMWRNQCISGCNIVLQCADVCCSML